jgi:molecular chaperone HscB
MAIEVNESWRVLRDPVKRAEALLARLGVHVDERGQPPSDPELLMEMMERREELAEARRNRDPETLSRTVEQVEARQSALVERMTAAFASALGAPAPDGVALLEQLGELRYYQKFLDDAGVVEDEIL